MEPPICINCGQKHWSRQPCAADPFIGKVKITNAAKVRPKPLTTPEPSPLVKRLLREKGEKLVVGGRVAAAQSSPGLEEEVAARAMRELAATDCPVCAERRAKKAAAQKRWRDKNK